LVTVSEKYARKQKAGVFMNTVYFVVTACLYGTEIQQNGYSNRDRSFSVLRLRR